MLNLSSENTSKIKEIFNIFVTANLLVFIFVGSFKLFSYLNHVAEPQYLIRTVDGDYYSSTFKHYGNSVTFLHNGEIIKKSQKGLHGTVVERIR